MTPIFPSNSGSYQRDPAENWFLREDVAGYEVISAVVGAGLLAKAKGYDIRWQEDEVEGIGVCSGYSFVGDPTLECGLNLGVGHLAPSRSNRAGFTACYGVGLKTDAMLNLRRGCAVLCE